MGWRRHTVRLGVAAALLAVASGCGDGPSAPSDGSGVLGDWIQVDGLRREYELFTPSSYDGSTPFPLVLALHPFGGSARGFIAYTGLDASAQRERFIVAFPQGINEEWTYGCDCTSADAAGADDVRFLNTLIAQLRDSLAIDETRIYLSGFSQGGFMSVRMACERPGAFAGLGIVGATMLTGMVDGCPTTGVLPVQFYLGTADDLVPYDGRSTGGNPILSADSVMAFWAGRNDCDATATNVAEPDTAADGTTVVRETWDACASGGETVRYTIEGGGHTWPGALQPQRPELGPQTRDIIASDLILEFFARNP